jgi:hypothetical protein
MRPRALPLAASPACVVSKTRGYEGSLAPNVPREPARAEAPDLEERQIRGCAWWIAWRWPATLQQVSSRALENPLTEVRRAALRQTFRESRKLAARRAG